MLCVGAFTCLFAAVIGITQDDIKRVLAFSTLSQLGYMMLALGVATMADPLGYTASMFHLFTHAFFKALLFLAAGAVIHAVHTNEIWEMGGLARKMPITHATFLVATLAIAGIWPLAGFFSKDEILAAALRTGHYVVFAVAVVVVGLTAFYMFRIYFVTFWGPHRSEQAEHAHEAAGGDVGAPGRPGRPERRGGVRADGPVRRHGPAGDRDDVELAVAVPATLIALAGIVLAWFFYVGRTDRSARAATAMGGFYRVVKQKFYIDEVYLFVTHRIIFRFVARPIAWFDRHVVDGGVNLSAWCTETLGSGLRHWQTGQVQTYSLWFVAGVMFLLLMFWAVLK